MSFAKMLKHPMRLRAAVKYIMSPASPESIASAGG